MEGQTTFSTVHTLKGASSGIKIYLCCESDAGVKGSGGIIKTHKMHTSPATKFEMGSVELK